MKKQIFIISALIFAFLVGILVIGGKSVIFVGSESDTEEFQDAPMMSRDLDTEEPEVINGYQIVEIEVKPKSYSPIIVIKDIPVKFNLHAEESNITECNNAIVIPEFDIEMPITPGDNIVEFTPTETGVFPYTCWMDMIKSTITVVDTMEGIQ